MTEPLLEVKNLRINFKTYAGLVQAVRGVDFTLAKGETLAIVGESGSGKSVTSNALMRLIPQPAGRYEDGQILFEGKDLLKLSEREMESIRGNEIAMIFQDPMTALNPTMRVGKQIMEVILTHKKGVSKEAAKQRAIELLAEVGIPDPERRFKQYPHEFSGGMRQRVVIAIALAAEPKILIADEPTTALDVTIQAQILELMKKIVEYGSSHDIFYNPKHPYTWGLLGSMPDLDSEDSEELYTIPGAPPNLINPPVGDAFAPRNPYALAIDYKAEPPFYEVSPGHYAKTWLLHPEAPKVELPEVIRHRIESYQARREEVPHA